MNDKLPQIVITPQEAQIIELSLAGEKHTEMRDPLVHIGACLVTKETRVVAMTCEQLWYIRDHIDLTLTAGDTLALDVIVNIYKVLCRAYDISLTDIDYVLLEHEKGQVMIRDEDSGKYETEENNAS